MHKLLPFLIPSLLVPSALAREVPLLRITPAKPSLFSRQDLETLCKNNGQKACGEGCIDLTDICCPGGSFGCRKGTYCAVGDKGNGSCCVDGYTCVGDGGAASVTTTYSVSVEATAGPTASPLYKCDFPCPTGQQCWEFSMGDQDHGCCPFGEKSCGDHCIPDEGICCEGGYGCRPGMLCIPGGNMTLGCFSPDDGPIPTITGTNLPMKTASTTDTYSFPTPPPYADVSGLPYPSGYPSAPPEFIGGACQSKAGLGTSFLIAGFVAGILAF